MSPDLDLYTITLDYRWSGAGLFLVTLPNFGTVHVFTIGSVGSYRMYYLVCPVVYALSTAPFVA